MQWDIHFQVLVSADATSFVSQPVAGPTNTILPGRLIFCENGMEPTSHADDRTLSKLYHQHGMKDIH